MRKIKKVLRLKYECGLSAREIARNCRVARSTVAGYLMKAQAAGLSWSEAARLTDTEIEERLFPIKPIPSSVKRPEPDYEHIYHELRTYRRFNLTLIQLWLEYKEDHPDGYQFSRVTDASVAGFHADITAGNSPRSLDDFQYRVALAITQIVGLGSQAIEFFQRQQMSSGYINNMDIVPNAASILGRVVSTEYGNWTSTQ